MNKIQSKNHGKGVCEINKTSLSCFHDKIYILNNGYNRLLLVIRVNYSKIKLYLNDYLKQLLCQAIKVLL